MNPVENFRITKEQEKDAFSGTGRQTNALTLADFIFFDPMIGIQDGKNKIFKLHHRPVENTVQICLAGFKLHPQQDYHVKEEDITFIEPLRYGDGAFAQYISICKEGEQP